MGLGIEALRTLSVVAIVYGSQATIYAIRGRRHFWGLRPSMWLVMSSIADLLDYFDVGVARNRDDPDSFGSSVL
jgi:hypothetical protein